MAFILPNNPQVEVDITALPSVANDPSVLTYTAGGGSLFTLVDDTVLEPGIYYGGNPPTLSDYTTKACDKLTVDTQIKEILSPQSSKGLFDIVYPANSAASGNINYFWNDVYTSPVGIYTARNAASGFDFFINKEILQMFTNDVNVIPRAGDYVVFNQVPISFMDQVNNNLNARIPLFSGTELYQSKVLEVLLISGVGTSVLYQLRLEKSFNFSNGDRFAVVLLNRDNTSIEKDLFYDTFEAIEVHRQQLLGDTYLNSTDVNKPLGRKNFLYYQGHGALGYRNMLNSIISDKDTPFVIFDANDDVKDRFSPNPNTYDTNGKPVDLHFEFHLPGVMIDDNVFTSGGSPVDASGNVLENIFVASPTVLKESPGVGLYSGLYLKTDSLYQKRYGYVFFDLRIVVIDHGELAVALGYNSNRNYTLPRMASPAGSGNSLANAGTGSNLDIVDVSNTTPIVIKTSTPNNLTRGTKVVIRDVKVQGNTNATANGEWFVDLVYSAQTDRYRFELWEQLPQYNPDGTRVTPVGGTPSVGNGVFVNNGAGNSGKVIGALPAFNYFYTYRVRNAHNSSTLPYAAITDFNFAKGGVTDNTQGSLYLTMPMLNWSNMQGSVASAGLGFSTIRPNIDPSYGIDIIIGEYDRNPLDPVSPNKITGIKNVMCIPLSILSTPFSGDPSTGISIEVKVVQDYKNAVASTQGLIKDFGYNLAGASKLYDYNVNTLPQTLLTGGGKWTIGEIVYRNQAEMYRTSLSVHVPADKWNDSTNPSYQPSLNSFISDKFISEVGILADGGDLPMIYAKISPPVKKNNNLDLQINLSIDF